MPHAVSLLAATIAEGTEVQVDRKIFVAIVVNFF